MKEYKIITVTGEPDWESVERAYIGEYKWGGAYRPVSYAQLVYIKNSGFAVKLTSYEKDPLTRYRNNMDPVYTDSCLEFFACFKQGAGYINCEVNSSGAILSAYGEGRNGRRRIDGIAGKFPSVKVCKDGTKWSATVYIGLDIVRSVYGDVDYSAGDVITGNFYKCGDECELPHYGSFSPVNTKKPDFHRPEYFAKFIFI